MFCRREPEGKEWARPQEAGERGEEPGTGTSVSELERKLKGLCGGWRSRLNHLSFSALLQNRLMLDSNREGEPLPLRASRNFLPVKTTYNCLKRGGKIQARDKSNRWDRRGEKATSPRP